jgi:hypothetical protein
MSANHEIFRLIPFGPYPPTQETRVRNMLMYYPDVGHSTHRKLDLVRICLKILIAACVFVQEKSVACSTAAALVWDASFSQLVDPSGRAVAGVHVQAYNNGDSGAP